MKYLLDTDICIYLMNGAYPMARRRLAGLETGDLGISAITLCELMYGIENSARPAENHAVLDRMLSDLDIHPFGEGAAMHFAKIRAALTRKGKPIGPMDTLIAAHALHLGACLVTNNVREFSRVPGLKTENWLA